jgi:hypothetical protein
MVFVMSPNVKIKNQKHFFLKAVQFLTTLISLDTTTTKTDFFSLSQVNQTNKQTEIVYMPLNNVQLNHMLLPLFQETRSKI